jgi:phosphocarrier protein HPr
MIRKKVTILNKLGLHARAAAKFVSLAANYEAEIQLERDGKRVNGKSIMGVMMLAASKGTTLELLAEGEDAEKAIEGLEKLICERFGEEE